MISVTETALAITDNATMTTNGNITTTTTAGAAAANASKMMGIIAASSEMKTEIQHGLLRVAGILNLTFV
jgi:hypothetical protein